MEPSDTSADRLYIFQLPLPTRCSGTIYSWLKRDREHTGSTLDGLAQSSSGLHLQQRISFHHMISTLSCTTIVAMGLILPYEGQIQRTLYCSRCMRSMWRGMKLIFCLSRVVGIIRISISLQVTRLLFGLCIRSTPTPGGIRLQTYPLDQS